MEKLDRAYEQKPCGPTLRRYAEAYIVSSYDIVTYTYLIGDADVRYDRKTGAGRAGCQKKWDSAFAPYLVGRLVVA